MKVDMINIKKDINNKFDGVLKLLMKKELLKMIRI